LCENQTMFCLKGCVTALEKLELATSSLMVVKYSLREKLGLIINTE